MNKKFAIIIIVILLVITAVVYVGIWNAKKEMATKQNVQDKPVSTEQTTKETAKNTTIEEAAQPADEDVAGIESDLNSVNDDSFGENTLSDTEVGL
jgi:FtsZ-interacting cell division protein ZipA